MSADDIGPTSLSLIDTLNLLANCLSALSCAFLLVRTRFIDAQLRQRLFLRQMVALATADVLYHLKHILHYVDAPLQQTPTYEGAFLCTFYRLSGRGLMSVSACITTHIGLTFAFQSMRKMRALELMSKTIPVCWLMAALVVVEDLTVNGISDGACPIDGFHKDLVSYPYGCIMILAGVAGLAATVLTALASRGCSDATVKKLMRQVGGLPITCFLTQLPTGIVSLNLLHNESFITFSRLCKYLNGFANVLAYALQSRYTPHLMGWIQNKPKHEFVKHKGYISQGGDLLRETMSLEAAKARALELEGCQGFCFRDVDANAEEVEVIFKDKWDVKQSRNAWTAYRLVRHADPTDAAVRAHSFHPCFGRGDHVQVEVFLIPATTAQGISCKTAEHLPSLLTGHPQSFCSNKSAFGPPETDMPDVPLDFAF